MKIAILLLFAGLASSGTIVAPNADTSTEAFNSSIYPFDIAANSLTSMRFQQVYDASQFLGLGPIEISQIAFRPDAFIGAAFAATLPSIQIDFSTTPVTPLTLNTLFSSNIGADDLTVFDGPLTLSSAFTGPANGPKAFDIVIDFSSPFLYNPAAGNLLMDVHNFGGGSTTPLDEDGSTGKVQSVFAGAASAVQGGFGDGTFGVVTQFTYASASVPEPSALGVLGIALAGITLGQQAARRARRSGANR